MINISIDIAIVCFKYPPIYSGYGKQLKSVTEKVVKDNKNVNIKLLTAYTSSEDHKDRLDIIPLLSAKDGDSNDVYLFAIKLFLWLIKNRKSYSAIHCVKAGPEAVVCNWVSKILNKPLVVKVAQDELSQRELNIDNYLKKYYRKFRHLLLKSSDYFVAISEEIESDLKKLITDKDKIIKIPNGVNTEEVFHPVTLDIKKELRKKNGFSDREVVLLYVGALNERKGTTDLLNALIQLDTDCKFRCILCGPILENENLYMDKIEQINQSKNIKVDYRGAISNPNEFMQLADIFILPSYSEGLPNVLLEAGSVGLPLITTDIGGSRDIVKEDYNGYIVDTNSPVEIVRKLKILIENQELRDMYGDNSRDLIMNKYSLKYVSEKYVDLYKYMIKK